MGVDQQCLQVGIVGATGYTGVELLRLLVGHPQVIMHVVTSDTEKDKHIAEVFPSLSGFLDMQFSAHDSPLLHECDVIFFATPHATSMYKIPQLLDGDIKIIDLSADFRLQDATQWKHWYGVEHVASELLERAVYGLPEINRQQIAKADLVANPGCYPTAVLLGFLPLLEKNCVAIDSLIADAKSGCSGAGRKAVLGNTFSEISGTLSAYSISGHRHLPEICQVLSQSAGQAVDLTFIPHLIPMVRGIFATLYSQLNQVDIDIIKMYQQRYSDEPFVEILTDLEKIDTGSVYGTNMCRILVKQTHDSNKLTVMSIIDNLVKGAAGQAIQNMNIMFGFCEEMGLKHPSIYP